MSDRFIIKAGTPKAQAVGTWWTWRDRVFIRCPKCEHVAGLQHGIEKDGMVSPSLDCPTTDCSFHEFVILEGWADA